MAEQNRQERFTGPDQAQRNRKPDQADDRFNKSSDADPAAGAKSPLDPGANWQDQSQGPSAPVDDDGNKKA